MPHAHISTKKKKKNPLQREQVTLIWNECRRQLLYSTITSLTLHLGSSKLEVFTFSRPSFCLCFCPTTTLSPSPAASRCPLEKNKSKPLIFDITGQFLLMKDVAQMSFRSAGPAGNQAGTVIR